MAETAAEDSCTVVIPGLDATANLTAGTAVLEVAAAAEGKASSGSGAKIAISPELSRHGTFVLVGRQAATADVRIQHKSLSRQHAVLYYNAEGDLLIQDLGGKHGTAVNGDRLTAAVVTRLNEGDVIQFGNVRESQFQVRFLEQSSSIQTRDKEVSQKQQEQEQQQQSLPRDAAALVEEAGKGLSGRAKREAELAAMMASLDQTPTYQKHHQPETKDQESPAPQEQDSALEQAVQAHHHLPVSTTFHIPNSDTPHNSKATAVTCLAVDPSGSRFAVGGRDQKVRFYDFSGMDQLRREPFQMVIPEPGHAVVDLAYSNTGDRCLVGTGSAQPILVDREGHELLQMVRGDMYVSDPRQTKGHSAAVTAVDWHPLERDSVLTSSADGTARIWNVTTGRLQFEKLCCDKVYVAKSTKGQKTPVTALCFHPGGREFAVGTHCGTIQIWNVARTNRPERVVQTGGNHPITCLSYSYDGTRLASRSSEQTKAFLWSTKPRLSSQPICTFVGLPTVHEQANFVLSPDGAYACGGATAMVKDESTNKLVERGSLNFYQIPPNLGDDDSASTNVLSPMFALEASSGSASAPVRVQWHKQLNQIFVGNANGSITVYAGDTTGGMSSSWSRNGALLALRKAGKGVDELSALLQSRRPTGLASLQGEVVVAPFAATTTKKRRRNDEPPPRADKLREPERPVSGKHKVSSQAGGVPATLQQFIADQTTRRQKSIAGRDPREALLQHAKPEDYVTGKVLDTKTMEQEEDDLRKRSSW